MKFLKVRKDCFARHNFEKDLPNCVDHGGVWFYLPLIKGVNKHISSRIPPSTKYVLNLYLSKRNQ